MASRIATTAKHLVRTMSTQAAPAKREFLVIVPDKPGTLQKRLEVRPCVFPSVNQTPLFYFQLPAGHDY